MKLIKTKYWIIIAITAFSIGLASYLFGFLTRNAELVVFLVGVVGTFVAISALIEKLNDLYLD